MCFSATASFVAAAVLTGAGVATTKQALDRSRFLLGIIPLLFAIQQFFEGLVWLNIDSVTGGSLQSIATGSFLSFSHVLWPIIVPLSVYLIETSPTRKRIILFIVLLGLGLSSYNAFRIMAYGFKSEIVCCSHIHYMVSIPYQELLKYPYLVIICLPFFIAKNKRLYFLGTLWLLSFLITYLMYDIKVFVSVWCFFAAGLSVMIYIFFRCENSLEGKK